MDTETKDDGHTTTAAHAHLAAAASSAMHPPIFSSVFCSGVCVEGQTQTGWTEAEVLSTLAARSRSVVLSAEWIGTVALDCWNALPPAASGSDQNRDNCRVLAEQLIGSLVMRGLLMQGDPALLWMRQPEQSQLLLFFDSAQSAANFIRRAKQLSGVTNVGRFGDAVSLAMPQHSAQPVHSTVTFHPSSLEAPRVCSPQPIFANPVAVSSSSFQPATSNTPAAAAASPAGASSSHSDEPFLPFRFRTALGPGLRLDNGVPRKQMEVIQSDTDDQARIRYRIVLRADPKFGSETAAQLAELTHHLSRHHSLQDLAWIAPVLLSEGVGPHWFVLQFRPPAQPRKLFYSARLDPLLPHEDFMPWIEWLLRRGSEDLVRLGRPTPRICLRAFVLADEPALRCRDNSCRYSHSPVHINAVIRVMCYGSEHAATALRHRSPSRDREHARRSSRSSSRERERDRQRDRSRHSDRDHTRSSARSSSPHGSSNSTYSWRDRSRGRSSSRLNSRSRSRERDRTRSRSRSPVAATARHGEPFLPFRFRTALDAGIVFEAGKPRNHTETIHSETDDQTVISFRMVLTSPTTHPGESLDAHMRRLLAMLGRINHFYFRYLQWIAPVRSSEPSAPRSFVMQMNERSNCSILGLLAQWRKTGSPTESLALWTEWEVRRWKAEARARGLISLLDVCESQFVMGNGSQTKLGCCGLSKCRSNGAEAFNRLYRAVGPSGGQSAISPRSRSRSQERDRTRTRSRSPVASTPSNLSSAAASSSPASDPLTFEFFPELTDVLTPHNGSLRTLARSEVHSSDPLVLRRRFVWRQDHPASATHRPGTPNQLLLALRASLRLLCEKLGRDLAEEDVAWCAFERDVPASTSSALVLEVRAEWSASRLRKAPLHGFRECALDDTLHLNYFAQGGPRLCLYFFGKEAGCTQRNCKFSHDPNWRGRLVQKRAEQRQRKSGQPPSSASAAAASAAASASHPDATLMSDQPSNLCPPAPPTALSLSAAPSAMIDVAEAHPLLAPSDGDVTDSTLVAEPSISMSQGESAASCMPQAMESESAMHDEARSADALVSSTNQLPLVAATAVRPPFPVGAVCIGADFSIGAVVTESADPLAGAASSSAFDCQSLLFDCQCDFIPDGPLGAVSPPLTVEQRAQDATEWVAQLTSVLFRLDSSTPLLFVQRMGAQDRFDLKLCFASTAARDLAKQKIDAVCTPAPQLQLQSM